ncbi:MAG: DUF4118 domain-containing protein, partial [Bacillota bacterium]|nr:DUF4118 domain-containing protein [Bacillota bacterium]
MIKRLGQLKYFLYTALITASATLLTLYLNRFGIGREIVLMIFLVGVFETTILTKGYRYSILAALLSAVIFSYFYSNPIYSFMIEKPGDIILLALFMIFAMITSRLATKLQKQAELARRNERAAKFMSEVTESFINVSGEENVVILGLSHIYRYTGCGCSVSLTDGEKQFFPDQTQSENSPCLMQPLRSVGKDLGTVKIFTEKPALPPTEGRIARVVVSQMALALDRELVRRDQEKTRIAMEHERVKSSLLRAISHDLRTPLTGIVGASGLLCDSYESLDPESVKKLLHDINEEALWLVRLVENILNMTRISEGKLKIHKDTEVVDDIVNEALTHVPGLASSGRLSLVLPGNLVSLPMDGI